MRVSRVRFTVWRLMVAVAAIAVALGLWISVGPILGFVLFLGLSTSGMMGTRIGRELGYVIANTLGVPGLNTSGRPGDDPFVGWDNFPWLLLSLMTISAGVVVVSLTMRSRAQRARTDAFDRNA
jgi:hypothetical protein